MRPVPIPPSVRARLRTVVLGEPGMSPADDGAPMPAEYALTPSMLYPGRSCFNALVVLDDADLAYIAAGGRHMWLTLDGAEVPWSLMWATTEEVADA